MPWTVTGVGLEALTGPPAFRGSFMGSAGSALSRQWTQAISLTLNMGWLVAMLPKRAPFKPTIAGAPIEDDGRHPSKSKPSSSAKGAEALSPATTASIQAMIEDTVRRLYVDPHAEALSIEQFCARYGVSRTTAYEQIEAGWLVAKKPPGNRRTLIPKVEADRWLANAPLLKPGASDTATPEANEAS